MTAPGYTRVGQQPINNQRITVGQPPFILPGPGVAFQVAQLWVDRTVNGGLNTLAQTDTVDVTFDYSHNGVVWENIDGIQWRGGVWTSSKPGGPTVTKNDEWLWIGVADGFVPADSFRVTVAPSTPVRITGTVTYFA